MNLERLHILAPLFLGILLTVLSYFDERALQALVDRSLPSDAPPIIRETIKRMVDGGVVVTTYFASSLTFLVNLLVGATLFKDAALIVDICFILIAIVAVGYRLVQIFAVYDLQDICGNYSWGKKISWWLKFEQVAFNVIALAVLSYGLYLQTEPVCQK